MKIKIISVLLLSAVMFTPNVSFAIGQSKYQEIEEKMSSRSNDWIKKKIVGQIKKNQSLSHLNITIEVDNGRVDLSGEVDDVQQINELYKISNSIDGVISTNTKSLKEK